MDKTVQQLLEEQRQLAQKCLEDVRQCLEFNETIAAKIAKDPPSAKLSAANLERSAAADMGDDDLTKPLLAPSNDGVSVRSDPTSSQLERKEKKKSSVTMFGKEVTAKPMREKVAELLQKKEYAVEDLYDEEGTSQLIARSMLFQNISLAVVALNCWWISVETDNNKAIVLTDAAPLFQIVDNLFTAYFLFEIGIRFAAFSEKPNAFQDGWFVFDLTIVTFMAIETYIVPLAYLLAPKEVQAGDKDLNDFLIFRVLRLLRLARVGRLIRLFRAFPELLVMTRAMALALRSLSATIALLAITIYVFGIMFTELLSQTETGIGYFENVPQACNTLLLSGVFGVQKDDINHLLGGGIVYYILIVSFLFLSTYTVLNMLIGVICEVITEVAAQEREKLLLQDLRIKIGEVSKFVTEEAMWAEDFVAPDAQRSFAAEPEAGQGGAVMVHRETIFDIMQNQEACEALDEVGIDVVALTDLADLVFPKRGPMEMNDFLQLMLQFRGSNTATVKDLVNLRKFFLEEMKSLASTKSLSSQKRRDSDSSEGKAPSGLAGFARQAAPGGPMQRIVSGVEYKSERT